MTDDVPGGGDPAGTPESMPEVEKTQPAPAPAGPGWAARLEVLRIPVMIVLALFAAFATVQFLRGGDDEPEEQVARTEEPVATTTIATTSAPVAPPPTTVPPPPTDPPPVTTIPPTTTTSTTTTTTSPPPFIEPVGNPIPLEDLTLSVVGIGPLDFGDGADRVLGRLAATFGQPDADTGPESHGPTDRCGAGTFREVQWGPLTIVLDVDPTGEERFHSFRVDVRDPDINGPASELQTLSGLKAGDSVGRLREIYGSGFTIGFTQHEAAGDRFQLRSRQGLLLWGPVTSTEDEGIVLGIFSTDAC